MGISVRLYLAGKVDEAVGFSPEPCFVAEWLTMTVEGHRAETADRAWTHFYPELILVSPERGL